MKNLKIIIATIIVAYFLIGVFAKANEYTMSVEDFCVSLANDKLEYELIYILGDDASDNDIKYQKMLLEPKYIDYINHCEFVFSKHTTPELIDTLYYKFIARKN